MNSEIPKACSFTLVDLWILGQHKYRMISITDNARKHLLDVMTDMGEPHAFLYVNSKGCGGHSYGLEFLPPDAGDEIIPLDNDHSLVIDRHSMVWLDGVTMDFKDNGLGSEFVFEDNREKCGCGQSFKIRGTDKDGI